MNSSLVILELKSSNGNLLVLKIKDKIVAAGGNLPESKLAERVCFCRSQQGAYIVLQAYERRNGFPRATGTQHLSEQVVIGTSGLDLQIDIHLFGGEQHLSGAGGTAARGCRGKLKVAVKAQCRDD